MADYIMRRFESVGKFLDACKGADPKGASHSKERDHFGGDSWHGTKTFDESMKLARYGGWNPKVSAEFGNLFDQLVPKLRKFVDHNMDRMMDVAGDEVNMGAYMTGDPDHMMNWIPLETEATKRALCLIIGHSISGGCSAEELFIRGQAAIALVRALKLLGFELEIWSEHTVGGGYGDSGATYWSGLVRIHAAGSIMDESQVEFAIGNPSWLRRLYFGLQETEDAKTRGQFGFKNHHGYGTIAPIQHANLVNADLQLNLGRTWFGESGYDKQRSVERGMQWVVDQLKELGALDKDAVVDWTE